ncbi:hypothetical protein [Bacillus sp. NPDC094106]
MSINKITFVMKHMYLLTDNIGSLRGIQLVMPLVLFSVVSRMIQQPKHVG